MNLICMAHKGEAQSFLDSEFKFTSLDKVFYISKDEKHALIITGEGIFEVLPKLAYQLGCHKKIQSIINLGIAGALHNDLPIGSIQEVHTLFSYGQAHARDEIYETSNSAHNKKKIHCISTDERILNAEQARILSPLAMIVDREAWAVARVSKIFEKNIYCYKYISDRAGETTKDLDFKKLAKTYSDALFALYSTKYL